MNVFQKTSLLLFTSATLLTACQQEVAPTETGEPTVSARLENFTSRGYDMTVGLNANNTATITTAPSASAPSSGDEIVQFASNVTGIGLTGDIFKGTDGAGDPADYELLSTPTDSRTYWAVPFDSKQAPIKIAEAGRAIIIIGVSGCKCSGVGSSGCYSTGGLGCNTYVCNYCTRDVIIIIVRGMAQASVGTDSPYTIVAADRIDYNGVRYQ